MFTDYKLHNQAFDEMRLATGQYRAQYHNYLDWLQHFPAAYLTSKQNQAHALFQRLGITFSVYHQDTDFERLIPFDVIPRIITAQEWKILEQGLFQRVKALNLFLHDIYHEQRILKAGIIPAEEILKNCFLRPEMMGVDVPHQLYVHIAGIDLVRNEEGQFVVLEDNLRIPSGVSYMLENRRAMMQLFPELFTRHHVAPVAEYSLLLKDCLISAAPPNVGQPNIVLLTPGRHNSAYFEHVFLAQQMAVELAEACDLFVKNLRVYMKTPQGAQPVHVIYRRVDDDFLDPLVFRTDSMLGVPGLMAAYCAGHVNLVNAVGNGIADDKSVYPYVPNMIQFYLDEAPIIANIPTWRLQRSEDLDYVLANLDKLVIKEAQGSGGHGMLIGPTASTAEIATYKQRILANPALFIAQPTLALSTCPTLIAQELQPRHVDLRPFILSTAEGSQLVAGGLTRVALKAGSLVVNSSQGGGTKDTWVLQ